MNETGTVPALGCHDQAWYTEIPRRPGGVSGNETYKIIFFYDEVDPSVPPGLTHSYTLLPKTV